MSESNSIISTIQGKAISLLGNDIDTDRIIPARFLRCVTFEGLGEQVFYDERFTAGGELMQHPFNDDKYAGGSILLVNSNFGCGSSREHAPQALMRFGIRAIIGESFAEIFAGNCSSLGIPVMTTTVENIRRLQQQAEALPETIFTIDVSGGVVTFADESLSLGINSAARNALLTGRWDSLDVLLQNMKEIEGASSRLPYLNFD